MDAQKLQLKVLIVDDEAELRRSLKTIMTSQLTEYDFEISEDFVDSTMRLRLKLAKGGGQAIIFEPYKDR